MPCSNTRGNLRINIWSAIFLHCKLRGSHSGVAEDLCLLICYAVSISKYSPAFRRLVMPPISRSLLWSFETSMTIYQLTRPNILPDLNLQILHILLPSDMSSLAVQTIVYKHLYLKLLTLAVPAWKVHSNDEQLPSPNGAMESPVSIP